SFRERVGRVRGAVGEDFGHQEVPFDRLVEELRPERDLSRNPLFQVMLALQGAAEMGEAAAPPVTPDEPDEISAPVPSTTKFDLTLVVAEGGEGYRLACEYATDLFDATTVGRLLLSFRTLLEAAVSDPDRDAAALPLLGPEERRECLELGIGEVREVPEGTLHGFVEEWARRTPEAPALVSGTGTLGWGEVNRRANRIAHHLRRLGVGPEVRVGLHLERGPEALVALLGILKAGGAYVPLDPAYPPDRVAYMREDAGISVLLSCGDGALRTGGARTVRLDQEWDRGGPEHDLDPGPLAGPDNLAYVIYTSGSTGRPKGVMVTHRTLLAAAEAQRPLTGVHSGSRILQFASLSFDASVFEILLAVRNGAALCFPDADARLSGEGLLRAMREMEVTTTILPPPVLAELPVADLPAIHTLGMGGEAVSAEVVARWAPRYRMLNAYGPTEVTIWATAALGLDGSRRPPIGRPIPNARVYLLDGELEPLPVGVPGELWIGGAGVARGYLGRPGLTAERFLPDPFSPEPGARMYRSGDRGRWLPDGEIDFLGRTDEQVKVRGFRIELGEIEAVLLRTEGIRDAVVVAREDAPGERRLVAYVVAEGETGPTAAELRTRLRGELPEYMVPAVFVRLDALPLTPSGKVDRRVLPAPEVTGGTEDAFVPARTPLEEVLAGIWAALLGVERVGVDDNFFELGGHSLLAARAASRISEALHLEVRVRDLFEHPTVRRLAAHLAAGHIWSAGARGTPVLPVSRDADLPLSFPQQRLWFLEEMAPGSADLRMGTTVRLAGPLHLVALERALSELVRRHESLRTAFDSREGRPFQVIHPPAPVRLRPVSIPGTTAEEREAALRRLGAEEAARPYDLRRGPLFRAALYHLADDDHVLLLGMHHIISDGWSVGILLRELSALYGAFAAGLPSPLPELPVQYADYAVWQRIRAEEMGEELRFWRTALEGAPEVAELGADRPRPAERSHAGGRQYFRLDRELSEAVRARARAEDVTLFMTMLAAFQTLLHRRTGSLDLVVGTDMANRVRPEVEGVVGFFTNQVPLRASFAGEPSLREVLRRVRETTLDAYAHQELPFERLVGELLTGRSLEHTPLMQVKLIQENTEAPAPGAAEEDGPAPDPLQVHDATAQLDLTLFFADALSGIGGSFVYSRDIFEPGTIAGMIAGLEGILREIAADPALPAGAAAAASAAVTLP
ncbi:MAG TPA: amino acid adenylation domain-containing protein, partial [Longimicrobiaceae bacterium]|nr:amino acid adenylation domain-containing protein [Longimicrobiaceae bacterium]